MKIYRGPNTASPLQVLLLRGSYVGAHFSFHLSQCSHVVLPVCTMTFGMIGLCVCGETGSHVCAKET